MPLRRPTLGAGSHQAPPLSPLRTELRATLAVAAPLAAANLAQMVMGVTDTVMVGHLGGRALAAAGLGAGLYFTWGIVCRSVLSAVSPLAAHAIGAGDHREAGMIAGSGLVLAAIAAVPIILLLSLLDRLLLAIGYDPALAVPVGHYLAAIRWGAPAFFAFEVLRALLAATARARIVTAVVVLGIPANAVLNWALIFGHAGMPALGIAGSGYATAITQWTMVLGLLAYVLISPHQTPLLVSRGAAGRILAILRLGVPIGGLIALEVGVFATTGILMGLLGPDALGAHQLVLNFASLTFMVPLGIGQAATVRVAFELGAGRPEASRRAALLALCLGAVVMGGTASFIWLAPSWIAGIYVATKDEANRQLLAIAFRLLRIAALFQIADGLQVIAVGGLRGYRDTAVPMLIAAIGYWGAGFVGGWIVAFPLGLGAVGLWWGLALGLAVVALLLTLRLGSRARAALAGEGAQKPVLAVSPAS